MVACKNKNCRREHLFDSFFLELARHALVVNDGVEEADETLLCALTTLTLVLSQRHLLAVGRQRAVIVTQVPRLLESVQQQCMTSHTSTCKSASSTCTTNERRRAESQQNKELLEY